MKSRILAAAVAATAVLLAAPSAQANEKLATDKGCTACHAVAKKGIGPAYKEVAKKYKGNSAAAPTLVEKVLTGGQGVWGEIPMPPNKVSADEAKTLVAWVLSL
jgi:cytochrome c